MEYGDQGITFTADLCSYPEVACIIDECGYDIICHMQYLCSSSAVCNSWKEPLRGESLCPTGWACAWPVAWAELEDEGTWADSARQVAGKPMCPAAPPAAPPGRRELFSEEVEVEDRMECADTPDELLAVAAGRLSLPANTCADLFFLGACEVEMVKDLCGKTCGACAEEGGDRRRLDKCTG